MSDIDYEGRVFHAPDDSPNPDDDHMIGYYHQRGDLVWAEFGGGYVVQGRLVGTRRPDGSIDFGYCQVLKGGEIVSGRCVSTPEVLDDGRIRLVEEWRRDTGASGVSYIEEIPIGARGTTRR